MKTAFEMRAAAAWITMDDGKVNAMSIDLLEEIMQRLDEADAADAHAVVLKGRPGVFSAGFDLKVLRSGIEAAGQMTATGVRLIRRLLNHSRPTIAVCTGHAYPMGAFLLLSSDHRICAEGAWNIGLNEPAIGIEIPQFALELSAWRLTPTAATRLQTAQMLSPQAAQAAGFVDEVLAPEDLDARAAELAATLGGLDLKCFAGTKARVVRPVLDALAEAFPQAVAA
ncbi:MAG: crotonase/enoyl-CoA hydratase family protein [Maricaulaceae bacterium]|jgi:enoyl-CoA hydratase